MTRFHRMPRALRASWATAAAASAILWVAPIALAGNGTRLPPSNFVGVRPAAMGQAFTAVADDQNAMYYNPAGLARLQSWSLEVISPLVALNKNVWENYNDVSNLLKSSGSQGNVVEKIGPIVQTISGENHYARAGFAPYFVLPNFGIGLFGMIEAEVVPHGQGVPSLIDFSIQGDTDARISYARSFLGEKLSLGVTAAYRERVQAVKDDFSLFEFTKLGNTAANQQSFIAEFIRAGWGIGVDTGLLFTPVPTWSPTIGVSVLNIGDLSFRKGGPISKVVDKEVGGKQGLPSSVPQAVNMGLSVTPTFGQWLTRASFDYRDINLPVPASQKPCFGLEGGWKGKYVSALAQGGLAEGYLSGGFEVRLILLTLRYATYKTERGYFPTQNPERRHMVQVKILL